MKLMVSQRFHTVINFFVIGFLSFGIYFAYFFIAANFSFSKSIGTVSTLVSFQQFYLVILLICSMTFLFDLGLSFIMLHFRDIPSYIMQRYIIDAKKTSDLNGKNFVTQKQVIEFNERVRNSYKVERVFIPEINV
jgi:hypothetical protein